MRTWLGRKARKRDIVPAGPNDDEVRLELARKAYEEVLDATKHQDDKIGRFLTAIAFFTAAVFTLSARLPDMFQVRFQLGRDQVPLPGILLALFLALVVISVLLFLVGLGPNLSLPGQAPGAPARDYKPSHLFFLDITYQRIDAWRDLWKADPNVIRRRFINNLIEETHNIAKKAYFKYRRGNEARGLFILALLSLSLGVGLGLWGLFLIPPPSAEPIILEWNGVPRIYTGAIFASFCFVLGYDYWRAEYEDPLIARALQSLPTLVDSVSLAFYTGGLIAFSTRPLRSVGLWVVVGSMALTAGVRIGVAAYLKLKWRRRAVWALILPIVAATIGGVAVWRGWSAWQLGIAGAVVVLLEVPRVYRPPKFRKWRGSGSIFLRLLGRDLDQP